MTNDLQERQHRWRQIEELCCFPIVCDGLLGHAVEVDEKTRKSSIAEALAICANLGGIGSLPDVNRRSLAMASAEQAKDNLPTLTTVFENRRSLQRGLNGTVSSSGRSSPADTLSLHSKSSLNRPASSAEKTNLNTASIEDNDGKLPTESQSDLQNIGVKDTHEVALSHEKMGQESNDTGQESNDTPNVKAEKRNFHVSHSTPTFSNTENTPVRSMSLSSRKDCTAYDQISPVTNRSLEKNGTLENTQSLSFEIFSSDENLVEKIAKKNDAELTNRTGSVEELSSKNIDFKKRMLKSLKHKKPASFDQISINSNDSSDVSKKRSIFSKLRKK